MTFAVTLCNLYSYFVVYHILDTYNIYMNVVIYLIDPIHYKLSFTGALICLFGCSSIFV